MLAVVFLVSEMCYKGTAHSAIPVRLRVYERENMAEQSANVTSAPGGTLKEYVNYLEASGQVCALSADGMFAWVPGAHGELMRLPFSCTNPANPDELRYLLSKPKVWVVIYLLEPDETHQADCFFYVCRDSNYDIANLKKRTRAAVRDGLKNMDVRLCSWDELAEKGYTAYADTDKRHGYTIPSLKAYQKFINARRGSKFIDAWGAWNGDDLTAWLTVLKIEDWAIFDAAKSATAFLDKSPNNALYYIVTRSLLVEEKRAFVSSGLSTVQAGVNPLSLHKFKIRMQHEAVPLRRVFAPHWLIRTMLNTRMSAWLWTRLGETFPNLGVLGKIAGMSRSLTGTQSAPLAWAQDDRKGQ